MIRYLLDTDHLSLQQRGHPQLLTRLAKQSHEEIGTSVVTMEEMIRGRLALLHRSPAGEQRVSAYQRFRNTVELFNKVPLVAFDLPSERKFQELRALRIRVGSQDLRIAAVALTQGLIVLTRNAKDFGRVPDLSFEDWTSAR